MDLIIQVLNQSIGWLNIPYILTSWRLGVFSWCKKHPSTWFFCFLAGEDFNFLSELFG